MAQNSRSPGYVVIHYTSNGHSHDFTFCIKPDVIEQGSATTVYTKFGTTTGLSDALTEDFVPLLADLFPATATFHEAEVFSQPTPEDEPLFIEVIPLAIVGTSGSATVALGQFVMTLRTEAGGVAKLYLMESVMAVNVKDPAPFSNGDVAALGAYLVSAASVFYCRDESYPILALNTTTKTNDALRKKYVLNT